MVEHIYDANILLYGLSEELSSDLLQALGLVCDVCHIRPMSDRTESVQELQQSDVNLVFCRPEPRTIRRIRDANPASAIIAVSRFPETTEWIDSIEAGADDYCAAPFESSQLRWMFDSCLGYTKAAA